MSECRVDAPTRNPSARPSGACVAETSERLTSAASALQQNFSDPVQRAARRSEGQALFEQGNALLQQLGSGPGATELASALREMEGTLARMTPEEATRALPPRAISRRASLAQAAQRGVSAGAIAYARTGNPEDFANAVVGDLSDRHLRALGRLGESDLRASLAAQGITGERADAAIDRVKTKIAGKFQRVVRERGQEALESAAQRLRAAADPGSAECGRVARELLSQNGEELLQKLDILGVNTTPIRHILDNRASYGRGLMAGLAAQLHGAMNQAADHVGAQAVETAEWGQDALYHNASASRSFPGLAQQVKDRWAMGGIVGEAVNEHVSQARENEAERDHHIKLATLAAGAVLGVISGGVGSAVLIAGMSATAREGMNVQRAWTASDQTTGRALAGLATADEAARVHGRAVTTTVVAGGAVALDAAVAGGGALGHHGIREEVSGAARFVVDGAAVAVDAAAAYGIELGAHLADAALNGDHH